jgi:hypothetical protein
LQAYQHQDLIRLLRDAGVQAVIPTLQDEEFEWTWMGKRGTLPKRLAAWVKNKHNVELSPNLMSDLGAKIARWVQKDREVIYAVLSEGPFNYGEMKDRKNQSPFMSHNSCWWSDTYAKLGKCQQEWLYLAGGYCFEIYSDPTCLCASEHGRAWAYQVSDELILVANGRWGGGYTATERFAKALAELFGGKHVAVRVNSGTSSPSDTYYVGMYDGAYLVGTEHAIETAPKTVYVCHKDSDLSVRPEFSLQAYRLEQRKIAERFNGNGGNAKSKTATK